MSDYGLLVILVSSVDEECRSESSIYLDGSLEIIALVTEVLLWKLCWVFVIPLISEGAVLKTIMSLC